METDLLDLCALAFGEFELPEPEEGEEVEESGRWRLRAALRALTLGGVVQDAFRENANYGDPVQTPYSNRTNPVYFEFWQNWANKPRAVCGAAPLKGLGRGRKLGKIGQNWVK